MDILYTANVFGFNHLDTVLYLPSVLLPQRLNSIRSLRLLWLFRRPLAPQDVNPSESSKIHAFFRSHRESSWRGVCRVMASMAGLRDIQLRLSGSGLRRLDPDECTRALRPLMSITQAETFEVAVPWLEPEMYTGIHNAPFRLVESGEMRTA